MPDAGPISWSPSSVLPKKRTSFAGASYNDMLARARALKAQGTAADDAAAAIQAEFQAQHPEWPRANGLTWAARSAYAEAQ